MPATTAPQTKAIGESIVSYLSNLTYPDASRVYAVAQLESIKDVINAVSGGGACVEVYGDTDKSERRGFGGRMWDYQQWYILSMCSLDTASSAAKIYDIRDAIVQPFQVHAQLGNIVSNLFHSQLQDNMRFLRIQRNGQFLRAHLAILETRQEWTVPIPPGVIS
jgi:hypothetical protein